MSNLIGEIVGGRYDIKAPLGQGGSGTVYLATKLGTNERYAVKTISTLEKNAIKLLDRETETLKRLSHQNIVQFIEKGYEERHNLVYLVLEYLEGQDIKTYFDNDTNLKTKLSLFLQIIDGISHAHSKNIVHRDIKPDNIKVIDINEKPEAKVLDFGIAIITTTILTNTIKSYHTPLFAAPEQITLEGVSRDSDIYSLGMTFLYLLSTPEDRVSFKDESDKNILYKSAKNTLCNSEKSQILIETFIQATNKERDKRPKLIQLRKVINDFHDDLVEAINIVFSLTPNLKSKLENENDFNGQDLKLKRHIESIFKNDSGTLHIRKSRTQKKEDRIAIEIYIETLSKLYYGFINKNKPTKVIVYNEPSFIHPRYEEEILENGIPVKVSPIVEVDSYSRSRETDLSQLINDLLDKEKQVLNEIKNNRDLAATFEQWQSVIKLERDIIDQRKKQFKYCQKSYDAERQILVLTLTKPISIEEFDEITSPPLPITISIIKSLSSRRNKEMQWGIGDIIDGDKSSNGDLVETLHISLGDFCEPEVIESILNQGKVETNFKAQESEINKRYKALREIRYGDSENSRLYKVMVDPTSVKPIESQQIRHYFNKRLDDSQQKAVCKALATEDVFLIQGPPGTGKTSVITEIILQILSKYPDNKILVSSQSNVAVDNVLIKLAAVEDKEIRCIRIGREEKIEEEARQFEVETAIIKWQQKISSQSLAFWENYQKKNEQLLAGVKKIIQLEALKQKQEELNLLASRLTQTIGRFNSELIISKDNQASEGFSEIALELIYEKIELENKILNSINQYTNKFGIEYPEQKQLKTWIDEEYQALQFILGEEQGNYERFTRLKTLNKEWNDKLKRKQEGLISYFIEEINVVGATCLGVARFKDRNFDWVIIDEAARSTASETFVPMAKGKKVILVGDHQQLPPIIDKELQERALSEQEIQKKKLETSLFEYLYKELPNTNKITLSNQYRMHPDIGNLVSQLFYQNKVSSDLVNHEEKKHQLQILQKSIIWVSTSDVTEAVAQEKQIGKSRSNPYEAKVIKGILLKIQQDYESNNIFKEVGVIAAYRSQISVLESAIAPHDKQVWKNLSIVVHTVDAFQGGECDIIIYNLVRNNRKKQLGFTSDDRRLNVALSRSRQLLVIVGNDNMAYQGKTPNKMPNPFKPLIEYIDCNSSSCSRLMSEDFI